MQDHGYVLGAEDELDLLKWAYKYDGYRRIAADPEHLAELLRPIRSAFDHSGLIPDWVGLDMLRAWAFFIAREYGWSGGYQPLLTAHPEVHAIVEAIDRHPHSKPADIFPPSPRLKWQKVSACWIAEVGDREDTSETSDATRYRIFDTPSGFELWVWHGPAEETSALGMMGADLRSQRRAKQLRTLTHLNLAKRYASQDLRTRALTTQ